MPAPLDDRRESLLRVGRAVLGEPPLAHPAKRCGVPAYSDSGQDHYHGQRNESAGNEEHKFHTLGRGALALNDPVSSAGVCLCDCGQAAPPLMRDVNHRQFGVRWLVVAVPVSRVVAAPRAVMKLRAVCARRLVVFGARHGLGGLRIDTWAHRRTFLRDVSVFACCRHHCGASLKLMMRWCTPERLCRSAQLAVVGRAGRACAALHRQDDWDALRSDRGSICYVSLSWRLRA